MMNFYLNDKNDSTNDLEEEIKYYLEVNDKQYKKCKSLHLIYSSQSISFGKNIP